MAGIARAAAETYARFDIPSIPLGRNKKPSIGDFKVAELSVQQSMAWFRQRPNADALGVPDGRLSGIVRLDIDEHGEQVERAVIDRAGDTPFKARTASGKLHLLYRNNSERRLTGKPGTANARPWSDIKVDLCGGGGYSISPPSQCGGGEYRFLDDLSLEQLLENRKRLPIIQGLPERAYRIEQPAPVVLPDDIEVSTPPKAVDLREIHDGSRDAAFWPEIARLCKRIYLDGGGKDLAMAEALFLNDQFPEPQTESWVAANRALPVGTDRIPRAVPSRFLGCENRYPILHITHARGAPPLVIGKKENAESSNRTSARKHLERAKSGVGSASEGVESRKTRGNRPGVACRSRQIRR